MRSLNELGAPDVQPSRQDASDGANAHRRLELAKWLSDWHLLSFLGTSGLLSEVTKNPVRVCIMLTPMDVSPPPHFHT
jgi:nuclear protein localization family protein 4